MCDKIPTGKAKFENPSVQKRFERFQEFVKGREKDAKFLEIAASLHLLSVAKGLKGENAIRELIEGKPGPFTRKECAGVQTELRKWQLPQH